MFVYSSRSITWSTCLILVFAAVASAQVVATVNNIEITQKQVDDSIAAQVYPLQQQLYALRKAALENLITTKILESEATARRISIDDLRKQLTLGEVNVTRAQVEEAYKQNASFFATMSPDEARERLRLDLENQARMKHYRAGLDTLRQKWTVTMNMPPPVFVSELDDGISPVRGPTDPIVTIVEFSDFECPFCRQVQSAVKQIVENYGRTVRLVFKHLPLEGHRNSLPAAQAAYCAAEQDRFWQFHDALFTAGSLSPPVFEKIASDLGLGLPKFQECVASERSRAAVIKDMEAARLLGIESTPSFVVNGKVINGALSFAEFQKIIEQKLNQRAKQSSTN
jgi:protein-disulfide isomerase